MSLFEPLRVGSLVLPNRVVMAPLGRARAEPASREPTSSVRDVLRATGDGWFDRVRSDPRLAREREPPWHLGHPHPGQVAAWQRVTDAVHALADEIFQPIVPSRQEADPARVPSGRRPGAPSAIAARGEFSTPDGPKPFPIPRSLELAEVRGIVDEFALAAANAQRAGFDGVEIHGANGFLIDQFLRDGANQRSDRYGGSIAHRARFLFDVVDAVSAVFGPGRVGVRISPHATSDGTHDGAPRALYDHVARETEPP